MIRYFIHMFLFFLWIFSVYICDGASRWFRNRSTSHRPGFDDYF